MAVSFRLGRDRRVGVKLEVDGCGKPVAKDDDLIIELHLRGDHDNSSLQMISAERLT